MDYALAKSLKHAGFPQQGTNHYSDGSLAILTRDDTGKAAHAVYIPTLEELIEACGDKFWNLALEDGEWIAEATEGRWREDLQDYCESGCCGQYHANNSKEAVARLWLALKKEKSRT